MQETNVSKDIRNKYLTIQEMSLTNRTELRRMEQEFLKFSVVYKDEYVKKTRLKRT
jgi:hypothetical protein